MKTILHTIIAILIFSAVVSAEEGWVFETSSNGGAGFVYVSKYGKTSNFMSRYIQSDKISDEVVKQFQKDYPDLWKAATKSSGNPHNPKVLPLRSKFTEMLLKTPSVRKLDKMARKSGYKISGATHEKLHLRKSKEKVKVVAVIWLKLEKISVPKK